MSEQTTEESHTEEVDAKDLLQKVKEFAADARTKRIKISDPDGDLVIELPLTVGAVAGGALVLAAPLLAAIGAIAALVTRVKLEVIRDVEEL